MSGKNDGGPAFPQRANGCDDKGQWNVGPFPGMSLRDWFAGQALASMTVAPDYSAGPCNSEMARRAYVIADSMLAERAKGGAE
jgi:hypothetical protein